MTQHYQSHSWVDYARGLVSETERSSMARHLEGCTACRRSADAFGRLAATTLSPEPPPEVVERARAIFTHPHPGLAREIRFERLRPRLLFDTAVAPASSGVRRGGIASRRLLFEAGRYFVDVDLARQPADAAGDALLLVVGQLVDRDDPGRSLQGLGVSLVDASDTPVARATSNGLGEFQLSCSAALRKPRLAVPVDGEERIEIDLPAPEEGRGGPLPVL